MPKTMRVEELEKLLPALTEQITKAVLFAVSSMGDDEKEELKMADYVHGEAVKEFKQFEDYPRVLTPKLVAAMLGITSAKAYQLMHHHECPKNPLLGKLRVEKTAFLKWITENNMTHKELLAYEKAEAEADGEK